MALLEKGSNAPAININDQNGNLVDLSNYKGKKVIVYFYPKDSTPGCTAEACSLRDGFDELTQKGCIIIGVSADSEKSHKNFVEKYSLPFTLAADVDKKVLKQWGVWGEKKNYGKVYEGIIRTTYIVSEQGVIEHVISKVDTKNHAQQILELL